MTGTLRVKGTAKNSISAATTYLTVHQQRIRSYQSNEIEYASKGHRIVEVKGTSYSSSSVDISVHEGDILSFTLTSDNIAGTQSCNSLTICGTKTAVSNGLGIF